MTEDLKQDRMKASWTAGLRRWSPAQEAAEAAAARFYGLPQGINRWRLAAAIRTAATPLGLSSAMLRLLDLYIELTFDIDWTDGNEPIICRPLIEIAERLGRTERQVRNIERALVDRGLLTWRDSGNHHRRGYRDSRTGRLTTAYGPSLAPLGVRCAEIVALAETTRREAAMRRQCRSRISALRRSLLVRMEAAETGGFDITALRTKLSAIPVRHSVRDTLASLAIREKTLAALNDELMVALLPHRRELDDHRSITAEEEISYRPIPDTKSETESKSTAPQPKTRPANGSATAKLGNISLSLILTAATDDFRHAATKSNRHGWSGLIETAAERRLLVGISEEAWATACQYLGRTRAALSVLIIEQATLRDEGRATGQAKRIAPVRSPDAYLHALVRRDAEGQLHLDRSIRALARKRAEHQSDPAASKDRGCRPSRCQRTALATRSTNSVFVTA